MKILFILSLFLFSFVASSMFVPLNSVGICPDSKSFKNKNHCESEFNSCISIAENYNCNYHKIVQQTQNVKAQLEECIDEADCIAKFDLLVCEQGIKTNANLEVYCAYDITVDVIEEDAALKTAYETEQLAIKNKADIMATIEKYIACGKNAVKELIYRNNVLKTLTYQQKKDVLTAYSGIKALLDVGNLTQAKTEINATVVDGILVTNEDKTALIAEIDKCLI